LTAWPPLCKQKAGVQMQFCADLHVHSRFSRATSHGTTLADFAEWGRLKGLTVVGTGDFTHPEWFEEIISRTEEAEQGLLRLRPDFESLVENRLPRGPCRDAPPVRFILQSEICTIYKKGGRTRKVHHVVLMPGIAEARRFNAMLARIGNLNSDGRPILGLDSRNLLEVALEASPDCSVIPAHIWTPWFSALGSKSGFDSVAECYADLTHHVFAVETGLSSDPEMNWRVSSLDSYRLVSCSDAHSPARLGREATVFDCDLSYPAITKALRTGTGYRGTIEFFPEEGKYHLDGHRKCKVCLLPEQTRLHGGKCPVCGGNLTVGVMNRVEELADHPQGRRPPFAGDVWYAIPLEEILSEILGSGPGSVKVENARCRVMELLGPELAILNDVETDRVEACGFPALAEAIRRMRAGRVIRKAGYDGEYGLIRLFDPQELDDMSGTGLLFSRAETEDRTASDMKRATSEDESNASMTCEKAPPSPALSTGNIQSAELLPVLEGLDPEQRTAAETLEGPVLVVAGPGAGKTRVLTWRIARLVAEKNVKPDSVLALTFTNRAADEMRKRLKETLGDAVSKLFIGTFHSLAYRLLREFGRHVSLPDDWHLVPDDEARNSEKTAGKGNGKPVTMDALIPLAVHLLSTVQAVGNVCRQRWQWVSVDEYQDLDETQYRLLRELVPTGGNIFAIGDPDQAIYGFRGSDVGFFRRFTEDHPGARVIILKRNYRSGRKLVRAALQAIRPVTLVPDRILESALHDDLPVTIHEAASDRAEAQFVADAIERIIGGHSFLSVDSGRADGGPEAEGLSFSDFAVLYRTEAQSGLIEEALSRSGMPFQRRLHRRLSDNPMFDELLNLCVSSAWSRGRIEKMLAEHFSDQAAGAEAKRLVAWMLSAAEQYGADSVMDQARLACDADAWDSRADRISLLTLHAAKGLEFPVVFITGCEDGILPLRFGKQAKPGSEDEERRLLFVGMTRARRILIISHAARRLWRGRVRPMKPSPFLDAIEESLLKRQKAAPRTGRPHEMQLTLF